MICAIIINWSELEMLKYCIEHTKKLVDKIILVQSHYSNFFEYDDILKTDDDKVISFLYEPLKKMSARENETLKRNYGLQEAKFLGFDHFIMMDSDEFYLEDEFKKAFYYLKKNEKDGLVCKTKVYFKSPALTIGYDITLVPFIHKLTDGLRFVYNVKYPFAFADGNIRIDPTRQLNINSNVEMCDITMHHFSWVRKNIKRKIANSTATENLKRHDIVKDYINAKENSFCYFYGKPLLKADNLFRLPEIIDYDL